MTIMSFAKYLDEDQYGIFESGRPNSFIWAVGSDNTLGYHADRGNFELEFESAAASSTSSSVASVTTSPFTTTAEGAANMGFTDGNITEAPAPAVTEDSSSMPVADIGAPTYSPTVGDVTTYSPTSDGQAVTAGNGEAVTASTSSGLNATVQVGLNETDTEEFGSDEAELESDEAESESVTTSSTSTEGANLNWTMPSPTTVEIGLDVVTPSPSAVAYSSGTAKPTTTSTESVTSNSTAAFTESSTSNSTSNSTQSGTQPKGDSQYSPGDFASGTEASASRETSAVSSHNIGGLVVGVAALAIAFGF